MILPKDIKPYLRFAIDFTGYLHNPVTEHQAREAVARRLANREQALRGIVDKYIYGYPQSPYLKLLNSAGWEKGDVLAVLRKEGIQELLHQLAKSGVYIQLEEFKGKIPAVRGSQSFNFSEADFDNPGLAHHLEVQSGGTRSAGTRVLVKLDFPASLADDTATLFNQYRLWDHAQAIWLPFGGGGLLWRS